MNISPLDKFQRELTAPSDKSQTIRAFIMGAAAKGRTVVTNPLICADTISALNCVNALGAKIEKFSDFVIISSVEPSGEKKLRADNSATTMRLFTGLLSGKDGVCAELTGDVSLSSRNMKELILPLKEMGADIKSKDGFPPLRVKGKHLKDLDYVAKKASAQVKSAVLLAGLMSEVKVSYTEPFATRRYTEDLIKAMGGKIDISGNTVILSPSKIYGTEIDVVGDISSSAYPIAAALLTGGKVVVKNVGYCVERSGFLKVLKSMGAETEIEKIGENIFGDVVNITCRGKLSLPFNVESNEVPALIDEIPLLSIAACFVKGTSVIRGAEALRNKESDRIKTTVETITALGGEAVALDDGIVIEGKGGLDGGVAQSYGDHRIAMSAAVGLLASRRGGKVDIDCVGVSYPEFIKDVL